MNSSQIYILIGILALAVMAIVMVFVRGRKPEKMSGLSQLAFIFIFAGIALNLGEGRFWGYGLMTIGGILALIDIVKKLKR